MIALRIWVFCLFGLLVACQPASESTKQVESIPEEQPPTAPERDTQPQARRHILFFGNSLTAGYGVPESAAFPALIQDRIDSLGLNYAVVNAGVSGETSTGGLGRIDWILEQPVDIFVLELGGNDGLRGIPIESTRENLQAILDAVKKIYPEAKLVLAGMQVPPNMGPEYSEAFRRLFPELARANDATLIPFLLEGVGGEPDLNLPDGIHPTEEGHQIVARNVWAALQDLVME